MVEQYAVLLVLISIVTLLGSIFVVPFLLARLPVDYFRTDRRRRLIAADSSRPLFWLVVVGKNAIGLILILLGVIMLVTPGQGLLTLLAGFVLLEFPGKYRLERRVAGLPGVLKAINWLRRRHGKEPLEAPHDEDHSR